jgi:hypothetical protein
MDYEMNFEENGKLLSEIKESATPLPVKTNTSMSMTYKLATAALTRDSSVICHYNFERLIIKNVAGGKTITDSSNIFKQVSINSNYKNGKIYNVSILGSGITDDMKAKLKNIIEKLTQTISFPDRKLKIGDSFTNAAPIDMPVAGGSSINAEAKYTYILKDIKGDNAFFDTETELLMNNSETKMKASGAGKGKMIFNIKNNMTSESNNEMTMEMAMDSGNTKILLSCVFKNSNKVIFNN